MTNRIGNRHSRHDTDRTGPHRSDHSRVHRPRCQGTGTVVDEDHIAVCRHGSEAVSNRVGTRRTPGHHHHLGTRGTDRLAESIGRQYDDDPVAVGRSRGDRVIDHPQPTKIEKLFPCAEAGARPSRHDDRPHRSILDTAHVTSLGCADV